MSNETITVHVSPAVATAYQMASEEDRRRYDLLINLQLTGFLRSRESLEDVMDEMGREAAAAGLTPEILDSILNGS